MMQYKELKFDFGIKEISNNYDKIMESKNVLAGLEYLRMRSTSIKQMQVIDMIVAELKEGAE